MDPTQQQMRSFSQPDTTFSIPLSANTVQDNTVLDISSSSSNNLAYPQETVGLTEYSFFYKPPNDFQIYNIVCKEIPISFELVSHLLNNDNNNSTQNYVHSNNHEFHFLKSDEKKCYKITCELISHSSVVRFLNKNIYGMEVIQIEQQEYIDFTRELRENLEIYLKQFFSHLK